MSIIEAIVQAVVQGLSEFLPISSSGHISLVQHFFGVSGDSAVLFMIILHVATLVAVVGAFFPLIWSLLMEVGRMFRDLFTGKFSFKPFSGAQHDFHADFSTAASFSGVSL